jgi:hypothetical protein
MAVAWTTGEAPALAQTATQPAVIDKRTDAERHQDRAEELRRAAEERVKGNLGYPSVQRDPTMMTVTPSPKPGAKSGAR